MHIGLVLDEELCNLFTPCFSVNYLNISPSRRKNSVKLTSNAIVDSGGKAYKQEILPVDGKAFQWLMQESISFHKEAAQPTH